MESGVQRRSADPVRSRFPDWFSPTDDGGDGERVQRLDELADWSGWLTLCLAEREPTFADVACWPRGA
jgi:hypothetical protein